jgi:hypothetical protein
VSVLSDSSLECSALWGSICCVLNALISILMSPPPSFSSPPSLTYFSLPISPPLHFPRDPRVLASQLAQKAHRRRERGGLRMDDITVMVVDVNPSSFVSVGGKNGGDGIHGKQGKDKCVMC